jgi:hypothetical protein
MKQFKFYFTTILAILFMSNLSVFADDIETVQAKPANDFLNSIGVNTSINARGENISKTEECVGYMGARYIRAGAPDGTYVRPVHFKRLHENCRVNFSISLSNNGDASGSYPGGIASAIKGAKEILDVVGGDSSVIVGFEGCNEPNNWGILYQGQYGAGKYNDAHPGPHPYAPLARYQRDFYAAIKADPILGTAGYNYPVWTATDAGGAQQQNVGLQFLTIPEGAVGVDPEFPAGTTYADVACVHNYFCVGSTRGNNKTWKAAGYDGNNSLASNFGKTWAKGFQGYTTEQLQTLRRVSTETGATINLTGDIVTQRETEEMQGLNYMSCYLAHYTRGFEYTAIYILRDRSDEAGNQTFGLYTTAYTPRLSAHYMHNLTTILQDTASIANPGTLRYGLSARPTTVHELLLQKEDGTFVLVVWGEKNGLNATADNIEVLFEENIGKINVYNPAQYTEADETIGTRPIATYTNVKSVPLAMLSNPFILEINPKSTTAIQTVSSESVVKVYSDPADNYISVKASKALKKIDLFDLSGKNVVSRSNVGAGETTINTASLAKGCYVLKTTGENNQVETHKIIK